MDITNSPPILQQSTILHTVVDKIIALAWAVCLFMTTDQQQYEWQASKVGGL